MSKNSLYLSICLSISSLLFCSCSLLRWSVPATTPCKITSVCLGASLTGRWIIVTVSCMIMSAVIGFMCARKLMKG